MMRDDISTCEDEFETIWIEIKNSKSQNVLCGCAYRHPNANADKLNDYVNRTMEKISKENKLIFLIGDFKSIFSIMNLMVKLMTLSIL